MRTSKAISTISYNSVNFLRLKLDELKNAGTISFWAFIKHKGEPKSDEAGRKDHIHLYVQPSKMLQTDDLQKYLAEPNPDYHEGEDEKKRTLGCIMFRASKFSDWYEYSIHDPSYLASKGLERQFHYKREQIYTSSEDDLNNLIESIDTLQTLHINIW